MRDAFAAMRQAFIAGALYYPVMTALSFGDGGAPVGK
jgi:hypothetical protein